MKNLRNALLAVAVIVSGFSASAGDASTEDDEWWLSNDAWRAIDSVMPMKVSGGVSVTFRSFQAGGYGTPERYFQISERPLGQPLTAVVVAPSSTSLQEQLLALHSQNPSATAEALVPRLVVSRTELSEASCPGLKPLMVKLGSVRIDVPSLNLIALDAVNYEVIIRTGMGQVDATLVDEKNPLVQWAVKSYELLRQCAKSTGRVAKP